MIKYKTALLLLLSFLLISCHDSERTKSTQEKVAGSAQEAVGNLTNDQNLKSEGKNNQLKGDLRSTKEDIKDKVMGN